MKKFFSIFLICISIASFTFANSNHDLQFHGGVGLDSRKAELKDVEISAEMKPVLFALDIQNWNFWEVSELIDVGFKIGTNLSFGKSSSIKIKVPHLNYLDFSEPSYAWDVNFSFGPAIAINCNNNLILNIAAGLSFNFFNGLWFNNGAPNEIINAGGSDCTLFKKCLGFDFEVQTRLNPNKKISPIFGYRLSACFPDSLSIVTDFDLSTEDEPVMLKSGKIISNNFYVGFSVNF